MCLCLCLRVLLRARQSPIAEVRARLRAYMWVCAYARARVRQSPLAAGKTAAPRRAWLSHPRLGKHAWFDGRYLHGVSGIEINRFIYYIYSCYIYMYIYA